MKLRLRWGLLLLGGLWLLHGFLPDPREKTALLVVAMAVALWTAFSLNIPPRQPAPDEREDEGLLEPPEGEDGSETGQGANGDHVQVRKP